MNLRARKFPLVGVDSVADAAYREASIAYVVPFQVIGESRRA